MALTPLPPAPDPTNPSTFAALADAFVAALGTMVTQINAQGSTPVGIVPSFRGKLTSGVTLTSGVETVVAFNAEDWDTGTQFDTTTGIYTPVITGKYSFVANFNFTAGTSISRAEAYIKVNGAKLFGQIATETGAGCQLTVAGIISTAGNLAITASAVLTGSGTLTLAAADTFFSGFYIGP